jgi:DNA-directed RNA polymerase specialized sigma24 family protein
MVDPKDLQTAIRETQEALERLRGSTEEFIKKRIGDRLDVDPGERDVVLDRVFQRILPALTTFDQQRCRSPFSWFMTVVDHAVVDYARCHRGTIEPLEEVDEPADEHALPPDVEHEKRKAFETLCVVLGSLPSARSREVLLWFAFAPRASYESIARAMRLESADAAKELKYRALKDLRAEFKRRGIGRDLLAAALG